MRLSGFSEKAWSALALVVAGIGSASVASAESRIDEIVVTVEKREESLQNTAAAVSTARGDYLRRTAARYTSQLEEIVPNLTDRTERPAQSFPVIRGIGTPVEGLSVDQGVTVLIDGVRVDTRVANLFSVLELERVEVLRGPQSTLYGRNSVGGVINLVSRRPSQTFAGSIRGGIGNYAFREFGLSAEGSLVPNVLAGRIGAVYQKNSEGYFRNTANKVIGQNVADNGASEGATVRGMLEFEPTEMLGITLSADYANINASGPAYQPLDDVNALAKASVLGGLTLPIYSEDDRDPFAVAHNLETLNDSRIYGAGLTINYRPSDSVEVVSTTGYRETEIQILEDLDASPYRYLEIASDAASTDFSQELRFNYSGDRVDGLVGLSYTDARYNDQFSVDVAAEFIFAAGGSEPAIGQRVAKTTSLAVFSRWEWGLTDRLVLKLGGRWSDSEKTALRREFVFSDLAASAMAAGLERCFVLGPGIGPEEQPSCLTTLSIPGQGEVPLPPTVTEARGEGSWTQFSPELGLTIELSEDVMAYLSYSEGYRDGGFEGVAANFTEFDKEVLHAVEIGIKSDLADGRLRANGALFVYDYEDIQLELAQLRNNLVYRSVFNAAEAKLKGAELETTWLVSDMLQLSLNVGWLDTEITEFDTSDPSIDPGFLQEGNELGRAPKWTASIRPVLAWPVGNGSITCHSEVNYKSAFFRNVENGGFADDSDALVLTAANIFDGIPPAEAVVEPGTMIYSERMGARVLVNSALSYLSADERFELTLWARNVLGEEYITDGDFLNGLGFSRATYGAPRTYGVQVKFSY